MRAATLASWIQLLSYCNLPQNIVLDLASLNSALGYRDVVEMLLWKGESIEAAMEAQASGKSRGAAHEQASLVSQDGDEPERPQGGGGEAAEGEHPRRSRGRGALFDEEQSGEQGGEQLVALDEPHKTVKEDRDLATMPSDFDDMDLEGDAITIAGVGVECTAAEAQCLSKFNWTTAAAEGTAGAKQEGETLRAAASTGHESPASGQGRRARGSLPNRANALTGTK